MEPFSQRVNRSLKGIEGVLHPQAAFQHVIWTLEREKENYEKEIWNRRVSPDGYVKLRAEYNRLCEDILIVQSLLATMKGDPLPERARPKVSKPPEAGY